MVSSWEDLERLRKPQDITVSLQS